MNQIFKLLYLLANTLILIGDWTRKIFSTPIIFFWQKIRCFKLPRFPKIRFNFIPLRLKFFFYGVVFTLILVLIQNSYTFVKQLPSPYNIGKINYPISSHIYDRNGKLLYEIYRSQNRTPVTLSQLPVYVTQTTVAIEDKDFYRHSGIAFVSGILRAVRDTVINRTLQGGSTITQQLVKSALLTPERTIERKAKEIILAIWAEKIYSKNQILEMYLNQVPYGGSSYGIEEAAKTYFGKNAAQLTLSEAAMLAGLPQAPSLYSPYYNPDGAKERRNDVIERMWEQGYITEAAKIEAQNTTLEVLPPKTSIRAPHFVFYTKSQLEDMYGVSTVEEGGLKVTTTLDLDIQEEAEKILQEELAKINYLNANNGAILITRPSTGEIIAMVGSSNYFTLLDGAYNVTTAFRQPGSSIKPIMYALAIEKGFTAATIIDDSPVVFNILGGQSYRPVNYDGRYHGKVPLRIALANSYNIPAVKTLEKIGVSEFIDFANKMGISTWTDKSTDLATAYGVLANNGFKVPLSFYLKIDSVDGKISRELNPFKIREIDPGVSYIISDILSDNFARKFAFGTNSSLEIPGYKVAVKTGTTDDKRDNWTIGYTPEFLVAVWVGNNDNSPMNPYLASGVTGASPIFNRVMSHLLKNYSNGGQIWYSKPEGIVEKTCYFGRKEYFIKGTESKVSCSGNLFSTTPTPSP